MKLCTISRFIAVIAIFFASCSVDCLLGRTAVEQISDELSAPTQGLIRSTIAYFGKDLPMKQDRIYTYILKGALLNWALVNINSATSGTFLIVDPAGRLFNFLENAPDSYKRKSSHFKSYANYLNKPELLASHSGYDLRELPTDKKTILFGFLNNDKTLVFVKPEEHGTRRFRDIIRHGKDYVKSVFRKKIPKIAEHSSRLKEWVDEHITTDDEPQFRKERVPMADLNEYMNLVDQLFNAGYISETQAQGFIDEAVAYGISRMHKRLDEFVRLVSAANQPRMGALLKSLSQAKQNIEKNYDNIMFRFGREVILTPEIFSYFVTNDDAAKIARYLGIIN